MTKRGKRAREKKEYEPIYRGGIVISAERKREYMAAEAAEDERRRNANSMCKSAGKAKAKVEEEEADSDSDAIEVQSVKHSRPKLKKNADVSKVAALTCPLLARMSEWSPAEYMEYDQYLVKKWQFLGWDPKDAGYLSIRDRNAKVARVARNVYNQP